MSAIWAARLVMATRPRAESGGGRTRESLWRASAYAGGAPCSATTRNASPSRRQSVPNLASQRRTPFSRIALNTGLSSPDELLMTWSTCAVAAFCSSASASFFCRSDVEARFRVRRTLVRWHKSHFRLPALVPPGHTKWYFCSGWALCWGRAVGHFPETVAALIRELSSKGVTSVVIAQATGVSVRTVDRYRVGKPAEVLNPLYDPARDGSAALSLTASICGDPAPGRRERDASRSMGQTPRCACLTRQNRPEKDFLHQCPPPKPIKRRRYSRPYGPERPERALHALRGGPERPWQGRPPGRPDPAPALVRQP